MQTVRCRLGPDVAVPELLLPAGPVRSLSMNSSELLSPFALSDSERSVRYRQTGKNISH